MDDKFYAVRIRPDDTIDLVETLGGAVEIHKLVDGDFTLVFLRHFPISNVVMASVTNGRVEGKPLNYVASVINGKLFDVILGDAFLLKLDRVGKLQKFGAVPFSDEEAKIVKELCEMYREKVRTQIRRDTDPI